MALESNGNAGSAVVHTIFDLLVLYSADHRHRKTRKERAMSNYAMKSLQNVVMKVLDLLATEDLTVCDASYVLQIANLETIEQGYSPQFREMKMKRQEITDARWKDFLKESEKRVPKPSQDEATEMPVVGTVVVPP
jgi:hypothetical protein